MKFDLGAKDRYALALGALGHLRSSADARTHFAARHFAGVHGKDLGFSLPDFNRLHERIEKLLQHFGEQCRRQYVLNCLSRGHLNSLPADILKVYEHDTQNLFASSGEIEVRKRVCRGLLAQIESADRVAPEPKVVLLELNRIKADLCSIRDHLTAENQRHVDRMIVALTTIDGVISAGGLGDDGALRRLRREHAQGIYKDLLQTKTAESVRQPSRPSSSVDPALIGLVRASERFVSGESNLQALVRVVSERLRGAESKMHARVLLLLAQRAADGFKPGERTSELQAVFKSAKRRLRAKGAKLPAPIRAALNLENAKLFLGLKNAIGVQGAAAVLVRYPDILAGSSEDKITYVRLAKELMSGIPVELRSNFAFSNRPDIYQGAGSLAAGIVEAQAELFSGKYCALLYRDGALIIAKLFGKMQLADPQLAAQVLGVLAAGQAPHKAKEIKDLIGAQAVSDVTKCLEVFCTRGWAVRQNGTGYQLGVFPAASFGYSAALAFKKMCGNFPMPLPLRTAFDEIVADKRAVALEEAGKVIVALEEFQRLCSDNLVKNFECVWTQLDKTKKPGSSGFYVNWRPADFVKLGKFRRQLQELKEFRMPELTYLGFAEVDRKHFRAINLAWREILGEHDRAFCKAFVNAMVDKDNRELMSEHKKALDLRRERFILIQGILSGAKLPDAKTMRAIESNFVDKELFNELLEHCEKGGSDGK